MREKDRRKKVATAGARKRSKSRSFSPPRRTSPYPPKRSRSRSFSRSPSPKRKRPLAGPKRRRSFSRSPSRSPPPARRVGKSRSRSRNRSLSPTPPGKLRRSPRRAPPQYSPSPPPSRFSRKDKDEYFDSRGGGGRERDRDRYDERQARFQNKSSYSSREYESKYDAPSHGKYDNPPPKHDSHKYDSQRQPVRPYHGHMSHGTSHEPPVSSYNRDKPPAPMDSKRPYDFEPNIVPPGTENVISAVPSLLDINIQPLANTANIYPITTIGGGTHDVRAQEMSTDLEKARRERDSISDSGPAAATTERKKSSTEEDRDKDQDGEKDRRRKSPVGKKHKKEKKKHKKKSREEKKGKKPKKPKDEKAADEEKSSDDEPETELFHEAGKPIPTVMEEGKIPTLVGGGSGAIAPGAMISLMDINVSLTSDNILTAAMQTAPCDSTVKSPDRVHELDANGVNKEESHMTGEKTGQVTTEPLKRRDSVSTATAQMTEHDVLGVPETKTSGL